MDIPKVAARKIIETENFTVKGYILESWADIEGAEEFLSGAVNKYTSPREKGSIAIGFTYFYDNPTLDLFVLFTPESTWSEVYPFKIKKPGGMKVLRDFCETEQRILEEERNYRLKCLRQNKFDAFKRTYPMLDQDLIGESCPCLLDKKYAPIK